MIWETVKMQQLLIVMLYAVCGSIILTCTIYAGARAAALGWYKTKLEHVKRLLHITRGG